MMRRMWSWLLALALAAGAAPALADHTNEWPGDAGVHDISMPSRRGPNMLSAKLYLPPVGAFAGPRPAVAVAPGGAQGEGALTWVGRALASHGYIVVVGGPGSGAACAPVDRVTLSCANEESIDVVLSGVEFLAGQGPSTAVDGPEVATDGIGAAGYSIGARAVSYAQMVEPRIQAIVAFDNLARDLEGDSGSASGRTAAWHLGRWKPIGPRVPAMGHASDSTGLLSPTDNDPDIKKAAYDLWRAQGIPAMQLVFRGSGHGSYSSGEARFAYYARAWFDRWLLGDHSAVERLLAESAMGTPRQQVVSDRFRSAVYLPDMGVDCEDLTACL